MKAIIYPDAAGEWRFHIRADNGEIIAHGESYVRRTDAEHVLKVLFQSETAGVHVEIHGGHGELTHVYTLTGSSPASTDEQLELPVQDAGEGDL